MAEGETVENLADLAPATWKGLAANFEFAHFKFCPSGIEVGSNAADVLTSLFPLLRIVCSHPVQFTIVKVSNGTKFRSASMQVCYLDGQRHIISKFGESEIPSGTYLVIFSPVPRLPDGGAQDGKAEDAIKVCRGLITAALGHTAAEAPIYACDSHLHEVRTSISAGIIENFMSVSAYSYLDIKGLIDLGAAASTHMSASLRERFETAMLLVGSATAVIDSTIRLMHTWIALEVVCGSRGKAEEAIRITTGGDKAPYNRIKDARDKLFHDGKKSMLTTSDERVVHAALFNVLLGNYRLPLKTVEPFPEA